VSESVALAKGAREALAKGLNSIQGDPSVPASVIELAAPIAQAMGALHQIEKSNGATLSPHADLAVKNVRSALGQLQANVGVAPVLVNAMEHVASSLGMLTKLETMAKAAPAPAAIPAAPQAAPAPQQAVAPQAAPPPAAAAKSDPQPAPNAGNPALGAQSGAPPRPMNKAGSSTQPVLQSPPGSAQPAPGPQPSAGAPVAQAMPVQVAPQQQMQQPVQHAPALQMQQMPPQQQMQQPMQHAPAPQMQQMPPQQQMQQPMHHAPAPQMQQMPPQQQMQQPMHHAPAPQMQQMPPQQQMQQPMQHAPAPQMQQMPPQQQMQQPMQHAPAPHMQQVPPPQGAYRVPQNAAAQGQPGESAIDVALAAHSPSNFYKGLSGNDVIDHGGLFVATYIIPKLGSSVRLRVALPGGFEFEAAALVQWARENVDPFGDAQPGFGAKLLQVSPEARQLIYRYVRNREPLFHDDM
jgi:hypothetical protein